MARKLDTGDSKDKIIEKDAEIEGYGGWKTFENKSANFIKHQGFAEIPRIVFKNGALITSIGPTLLFTSFFTMNYLL